MSVPRVDHAAFYNRIAHAYDLIADPGEAAARRRGEAALAVQPGETVLEIGYGTGNSLEAFARLVGDNGKVVGVDISSGMQNVARGRLEAHPELSQRVDLTVGDARSLPFTDGTFDAVFASFTLELFDNAEIPVVLTEIRRVLRPGGRVGLVTMAVPADRTHDSRLEHVYVWMHQHFPHIVDCHPIVIEPLLRETGFRLDHRDQIAIWTLPVDITIARRDA